MRILFVHQNFPGQYRHIAPAMAERGNEVLALGTRDGVNIPGVKYLRHLPEPGAARAAHPLVRDFAVKVSRGISAARVCQGIKKGGFSPDIILGHHGWGETLFLRDVWPDTKLLSFCEFCYSPQGSDVAFDPEFPLIGRDAEWQIRVKNAAQLLAMQSADWLITPTKWQARQIPFGFRSRVAVIHDGIDTHAIRPNQNAFIELGRECLTLRPGSEVITFVNRNLEPYRGYHKLMRALPAIMKCRPNARVVVVGGDGVSYGSPPPGDRSFKQIFLDEVKDRIDLTRIHFVGNIKYIDYIRLLQVSAVHVYLTYPFVLSWSFLEAMAAGCCVVGSDTAPVTEILRDGENGLVVDFHCVEKLSDAVISVLRNPDRYRRMRENARRSALVYDLKRNCLPRHIKLINDLVENKPILPFRFLDPSPDVQSGGDKVDH